MKIITRYVLKEHIGPFVFALSALTSLLLLQYIARRFGDLVGRGLSWGIITEFFLLSIPFTLAMTLPMAVLVSVLYAFSRLASENEITAFKAGGISARGLMRPAIVAATFLAMFMMYFNDQLLPRANHELATLQMAILRTKPTFALRPQVINTIKEGQLYLRAGQIDEATGLMHDVTIYDLTDARRRKTVFADSGTLAFLPNRVDLSMHLYHGWMLTSPANQPGQLDRIFYKEDILKVRDVGRDFQLIDADTNAKGDREMSVCEMQQGYERAHAGVRRAHFDSVLITWRENEAKGAKDSMPKPDSATLKAGGIGALYCRMIDRVFKVKEAQAAEVPRGSRVQGRGSNTLARSTLNPQPSTLDPQQQQQDSAKAAQQKDSLIFVIVKGEYKRVHRDSVPDDASDVGGKPLGKAAIAEAAARAAQPAAVPGAATPVPNPAIVPTPGAAPPVTTTTAVTAAPEATITPPPVSPEMIDAKARLDDARHRRNRYGIEIQKKFSLAAACIVFVLVGAPLALRFPRGGVGLVIGASFFVFSVYYIGLIGGESLANKNIISPFWAMWADNLIFLAIGLILMARMGNEGVTSRGGNWGERVDAVRMWFARQGRRGMSEATSPEAPT